MTNCLCPLCQQHGRLLDVSREGYVAYYRCDPCGNVWATDKSDANATAIPISRFATAFQSEALVASHPETVPPKAELRRQPSTSVTLTLTSISRKAPGGPA
jgi:uncharacterized Zn finger protein